MKSLQKSRRRARSFSSRRARDRSLWLTIVAGLLLLSVLGLVFSVAQGSQRITSSAGSLHTTDEVLRSATVARAQVALVTHMATVDRLLGTNSASAIELSASEASQARADLLTGLARLKQAEMAPEALVATAGRFESTVESILALVDQNDLTGAQGLAGDELVADFEALSADLVELRRDLADEVAASDAVLGRVGNVARYLVAFLIPAAIVVIYRALLHRQHRQAELESRLENERELNASREMFIANASHELRTPLTSIVGLSMLLAEKPVLQSDTDAAQTLDIVISEADDLSRMVDDLLTTARLDSGALHYTFDNIDVVEEVDELVGTLRRAGMDISASCQAGSVRADRLRFRQVLRNLLSNARKYGGPSVRVEGRIEGRTYLCSVIDNGAGIPAEIAPRLFQRFIHQGHATATKDSVGLGLSIVHALAQGMGGSITYERIDDETHFSLRVPLVEGEPTMEPMAPESYDVGAPAREAILDISHGPASGRSEHA